MSALHSAVENGHQPDGVRALRPPIRTGDIVRHLPSGETWVVAWADEQVLIACGWPESLVKVTDCELIDSCSDEEHWKLVEEIAKSSRVGDAWSMRRAHCFALLDSRFETECAAMMHL